MTCKFKAGETYRTRDGREVRIYATDGAKPEPIHGAVQCPDGWGVTHWRADGEHPTVPAWNLMPPTRQVWVAVYRVFGSKPKTMVFHSKSDAECWVAQDSYARLAVLGPVEIEDTS